MLELELLQVALGQRPELSRVPTLVEWQQLSLFAEEQSMIGLFYGGIEKLPKAQLPEMDLLMDWIGQEVYIKTQKEEHDKVISTFARFIEHEQIKYVVF